MRRRGGRRGHRGVREEVKEGQKLQGRAVREGPPAVWEQGQRREKCQSGLNHQGETAGGGSDHRKSYDVQETLTDERRARSWGDGEAEQLCDKDMHVFLAIFFAHFGQL